MKKKITLFILLPLLGLSGITAQVNPDSGLVAKYLFNGNANDESGYGNNGTVHGAVLTSDRYGNTESAYEFNGADSWIDCGNDSSLTLVNQISITAWINVYGVTSDHQIIVAKWYDNDSWDIVWTFELQPNGNILQLPIEGISTDNYSNASSTTAISSNNWYLVAGVFDGSSIKLYINGNQTCNFQNSGTLVQKNTPVFIGAHDSYADRNPFYGKIDDVCIYNRVLSESEIQALYHENACYQYVTIYDTTHITITDTNYISVTDTLIINAVLTGQNPPENINNLKVYPNPANTHIYIDNGNFSLMSGYTVRITNSLNQIVFETPIHQKQYYIDLSGWTGAGIYFIHIIDNNGDDICVKKIILN